jgi:hypothetical protein
MAEPSQVAVSMAIGRWRLRPLGLTLDLRLDGSKLDGMADLEAA